MKDVNENIQHERELAAGLLDFRQSYQRLRFMLPNVSSVEDLLLLSGAFEQAVSARLDQTKPRIVLVKPDMYDGMRSLEAARPARRKRMGSKNPRALSRVIPSVMGTEPMTIQAIFDALKAKDLLPKVSDPRTSVGKYLATDKKRFKRVAEATYLLLQARPRKITWTERRTAVLRTLATHGEPISTPDLARLVGLDGGQPLVPLLVSLRAHGALKKITRANGIVWQAVSDKLLAYDAEHGGTAFPASN